MENTITTKVTPDSTSEKAGIVGYGSGGNAIYGNTGSTTAITADKLKPVQPYTLPQKQTDTTADQLSGFIASTTQSNKTQAQRELDMMNQQTQQVKDTTGRDLNATLQSILGTNTEIGNVESTVDRTEQDRALKEYNNYTSQIEAEQLANRRAIESMQKNNPQGLFGGALQDEVARINRDSVSKQADLAILQNVSNRNYATAAQIADRQVEMKLKPLQTKLENLKFFYESNKSRFDKADDRLYANKIKEIDREYERQKDKEQLASQMKLAKYKADLDARSSVSNSYLSPAMKLKVAANPQFQKVQSKISLSKALEEYKKQIDSFKTTGVPLAKLGIGERRALKTTVDTVIGPSLNVAVGQGALSQDEADRILSKLTVNKIGSGSIVKKNADAILSAYKTINTSDLNTLDSLYPGVIDGIPEVAEYYYGNTSNQLTNDDLLNNINGALNNTTSAQVDNSQFFSNY